MLFVAGIHELAINIMIDEFTLLEKIRMATFKYFYFFETFNRQKAFILNAVQATPSPVILFITLECAVVYYLSIEHEVYKVRNGGNPRLLSRRMTIYRAANLNITPRSDSWK